MSSHKVEVIKLGKLEEHPNADRLWITSIYAYPVITQKDGFKEGDLVAYIPIDSVVPDTEGWNYLSPADEDGNRLPVGEVPEKYRRIKAKKLRGVFSMGLLHPAPHGAKEGDNVAEELGITKYVPPETLEPGGEDEPDHPLIPKYTDIENYLRYSHKFEVGERVVITEKLHGANARYAWMDDRLYVGSHGKMKKYDPKNQWWAAAEKIDLASKLQKYPGYVFFGELIGTQDLKYGLKNGAQTLRFFDILDTSTRNYLDFEDQKRIFKELNLEMVPPLYEGMLLTFKELRNFTEANSRLDLKGECYKLCKQENTLCEGIVIKPIKERQDSEFEIGRVILKLISERYLTRKGGTEAK